MVRAAADCRERRHRPFRRRPCARGFRCGCKLTLAVGLKLLPRRPEQDFVYVHVFRLANREGHGVRERVSRNRDFFVEVVDARGYVGLGNAVRQLCGNRTRRNDRCADVVGLHFLAQPFRERADCVLSRSVDCTGGRNLVAGHGRHIDDMSGLLSVNSLAIASRRSVRRAPSTTRAPAAERCRAAASPRPLLAPVMTMTFPAILPLMILSGAHALYCWSVTYSIVAR